MVPAAIMRSARPGQIKLSERKLGRERASGQARQECGLIEIDPRQGEPARPDTLVHEVLHVMLPDFHENAAKVIAAGIAAVVRKDGWLRVRGLEEKRGKRDCRLGKQDAGGVNRAAKKSAKLPRPCRSRKTRTWPRWSATRWCV